jgi:hypothetical protein
MSELLAALLILLVVLPFIVFWAWMFADMTHNDRLSGDARRYWLGAFFLLNVFGAALYYSSEYRNRL